MGKVFCLNGHEFEHVPGDGEGQRSLASCSPWGHNESDKTERLNSNSSSTYYNNPPTLGNNPLNESFSILSPGLFFIWYYTTVLLKTLYINTLIINILSETLLTIVQLLVLKQNKFYKCQCIYIWQISKYHSVCIWHLQFPREYSYRGVTPTAPIPCHLTWKKSSLILFNFGIYLHLYH